MSDKQNQIKNPGLDALAENLRTTIAGIVDERIEIALKDFETKIARKLLT